MLSYDYLRHRTTLGDVGRTRNYFPGTILSVPTLHISQLISDVLLGLALSTKKLASFAGRFWDREGGGLVMKQIRDPADSQPASLLYDTTGSATHLPHPT